MKQEQSHSSSAYIRERGGAANLHRGWVPTRSALTGCSPQPQALADDNTPETAAFLDRFGIWHLSPDIRPPRRFPIIASCLIHHNSASHSRFRPRATAPQSSPPISTAPTTNTTSLAVLRSLSGPYHRPSSSSSGTVPVLSPGMRYEST